MLQVDKNASNVQNTSNENSYTLKNITNLLQ